MERKVQSPSGEIRYILTQKQVKNINLRIKADGSVSVSASPRVPLKELDAFVIEKAEFILGAQEKFAQATSQQPEEHSFTTGDRFLYLGQWLTLEVVSGSPEGVTQQADRLIVQVLCPEDLASVEKQVAQFFATEAERIFTKLMAEYQERMAHLQIPQAQLKIKKMKSRWGSCHRVKAVITLNSCLIHTPYPCIEYVVLHEFCHFIHGNHAPVFFALVAEFMPDWKPRRRTLKQMGYVL